MIIFIIINVNIIITLLQYWLDQLDQTPMHYPTHLRPFAEIQRLMLIKNNWVIFVTFQHELDHFWNIATGFEMLTALVDYRCLNMLYSTTILLLYQYYYTPLG